jgi:hypothetical protein
MYDSTSGTGQNDGIPTTPLIVAPSKRLGNLRPPISRPDQLSVKHSLLGTAESPHTPDSISDTAHPRRSTVGQVLDLLPTSLFVSAGLYRRVSGMLGRRHCHAY